MRRMNNLKMTEKFNQFLMKNWFVLTKYLEKSTLHGAQHMGRSDRSKFER